MLYKKEKNKKKKNCLFGALKLQSRKMGIPSEIRDVWIQRKRNSFIIPSPAEDEKNLRAKQFSQEGIRAGVKAAAVAAVVSAVPTLIAVRKIPWAKANLNHTAQALIISGGILESIAMGFSHKSQPMNS
ncbi:hypothetical protein Goshw_027992 [Gossypium schwendimanii]|uniref:Early nodulin-93-like n=2 Tax=Gossypium TaxID=3633 RepID=A0A7J9MEN5_GOSSC|nr:hypothetical protein [Gossypium schwendimanii]